MRRGFTILELLVASMLLGMLTTILTMVFTQSSVAWNIGTSIDDDLGRVHNRMAEIHEEADNAFMWGKKVWRLVSPWDKNGNLRTRAYNNDGNDELNWIPKEAFSEPWSSANMINNFGKLESPNSYNTYTVNVMSGGPNNDIMDWQAIWSYPDDFD